MRTCRAYELWLVEFNDGAVRDVFSYGGSPATGTFAGPEFRDSNFADPADCGARIDLVYGVEEIGASSDMIADDHA
jgi:hypothetical protein